MTLLAFLYLIFKRRKDLFLTYLIIALLRYHSFAAEALPCVNEGGETLISFLFTVNEGQACIAGIYHLREFCYQPFLEGMSGILSHW